MYTIADILNSLTFAGLHILYFHEFQENMCDFGGIKMLDNGLWNYDFNKGHFPMMFSLKAVPYKK